MQRYIAKLDENNNIILSENDIFHIEHVMRMKLHDEVEVLINEDVYLCEISSFNPVRVEIIHKIDEYNELGVKVKLFYCIPKGDKIDLVLQKATELGVSEIYLVNSSRTIAKITKDNKKKKFERFNKIIKEAVEQSKRNVVPNLVDVIDYKDVIKYNSDLNLIAYERCSEDVKSLKDLLENFKEKTINILIGAEGGFSKEEVEYVCDNGYKSVSLGKRILRSETSVFYFMSILGYEFE